MFLSFIDSTDIVFQVLLSISTSYKVDLSILIEFRTIIKVIMKKKTVVQIHFNYISDIMHQFNQWIAWQVYNLMIYAIRFLFFLSSFLELELPNWCTWCEWITFLILSKQLSKSSVWIFWSFCLNNSDRSLTFWIVWSSFLLSKQNMSNLSERLLD